MLSTRNFLTYRVNDNKYTIHVTFTNILLGKNILLKNIVTIT